MLLYFFIITFFSIVLSNDYYQNVIRTAKIFGVGENIQINDPAALSLGNSSFFSGNMQNISIGSPSSSWRSALTRFSIHSGINYLKNTKFPNQSQHSLTSFSLFFPVGNKKVFGIGLQPVYRTNKLEIADEEYQFIGADQSITGSPIAIKNTYQINNYKRGI